ncbi:MAG: PD-(D/E)XK nuclease family protein, partial [Acidimicrobiales bacterium]
LEALARRHAEAEGVADRAAEVERLVRAALGTDVVRMAAGARHWRELYVGAPVGDRVLEGFVDLLFEGPDGLEVVDYKTDRVDTDDEIDRLLAHYRLQGAAYALAAASAVGRPVRRCSFLFLRGDSLRGTHAVVRAIEDLDAATAEVRALLEGG